MSTHTEGADHIEDHNDDGQLTIRIPNPKVYMARQSQWIGRRGKPRCDHCRSSSLKCDRVLPICNHCSWANLGECKYTPLPTPAHRGIPRCDRCRAINLKCDRNLPVCNNCKEGDQTVPCNYTPKKRHKTRSEDSSLKSGQKILPKTTAENKVEEAGHTFYGHNIAISHGTSASPSDAEVTPDPGSSHTGRFTAEFAQSAYPANEATQVHRASSPLGFISHAPPQDHKIVVSSDNAHLEPLILELQSFVSLPKFALQCLRQLEAIKFPDRHVFDSALSAFYDGLMNPLKETAYLPMAEYAAVARYLSSDNTTNDSERARYATRVSERVRSWAAIHRLCAGSEKYHLILAPRDSVFSMDAASAETHRQQFVAALFSDATDIDNLQVYHYDRLAARAQLFDLLSWAHRSHLPAPQMLLEVARLRFAFITWPMAEIYVRMCPLCNTRSEQEQAHPSPSPGPQDG